MFQKIIPLTWQDQVSLYKKALDGDSHAALHLVKRLTPKAHAVAWRILGSSDDAEDILQEAFIKLFKSSQFEGGSSIDTYFYKIVTRLCFDYLKIRHPHLIEALDDAVVDGVDVCLEVQQSSLGMQEAIQLLSPRQRMAIALWAYKDADVGEIAAVLDLDNNAAHQLLHRAKLNLKKILEGHTHVR